MSAPTSVLLTDPDQRACLAAVRSLAHSGYRTVTFGMARGLAGHSRGANSHVYAKASPEESPEEFALEIKRAVIAHRIDVVVPITDVSCRVLLGRESQIGCRIAGPTAEAYARASDKLELIESAKSLGVLTPQQIVVARSLDFSDVQVPWVHSVVKPHSSTIAEGAGLSRIGVAYASGNEELSRVLLSFPSSAFPVAVQERVVGSGVGVFLLRRGGETLLKFAHRRIREKPPSGGVSTFREAIDVPQELLKKCEALLDAVSYEGAAMIEFKQDSSTGGYYLMEINARLWGSVQLAIDSGVDFPAYLVSAALGMSIPSTQDVRLGTRTYWELGELDHALAIWRKSAEQLAAPPDLRLGARAALRALADRRWADRPEVFRWSDPMPFVVELLRWIRRQ